MTAFFTSTRDRELCKANVKAANSASRRLFERAGFVFVKDETRGDCHVLRFQLRRPNDSDEHQLPSE